jgi:hypothetical protein
MDVEVCVEVRGEGGEISVRYLLFERSRIYFLVVVFGYIIKIER